MKPTEPKDPPAFRELAQEYAILRELGRGATGTVYLAKSRRVPPGEAGHLVALKVVRPHYAEGEALVRLAREARTVARLDHPNIVRHYEFRPLRAGGFAVVMQYVSGETLAARVARTPLLPIPEIERILGDVARALDFAHERGVVHRDIKPQNILIDAESGASLLSDFGIAKSTEGDSTLTIEGMAVGTPTYMSPEQIDGRSVDGRSDLYSLGLVGWEMLSGSRPWAGESLYGVMYRQKHEELTPVAELREDVPPRLALALGAVLHKRPSMRLPNAAEFLLQLASDDPTPVTRLRRWMPVASLDEDLAADSSAPTLQFPVPPLAPAPRVRPPASGGPGPREAGPAEPSVHEQAALQPLVREPLLREPLVREPLAREPMVTREPPARAEPRPPEPKVAEREAAEPKAPEAKLAEPVPAELTPAEPTPEARRPAAAKLAAPPPPTVGPRPMTQRPITPRLITPRPLPAPPTPVAPVAPPEGAPAPTSSQEPPAPVAQREPEPLVVQAVAEPTAPAPEPAPTPLPASPQPAAVAASEPPREPSTAVGAVSEPLDLAPPAPASVPPEPARERLAEPPAVASPPPAVERAVPLATAQDPTAAEPGPRAVRPRGVPRIDLGRAPRWRPSRPVVVGTLTVLLGAVSLGAYAAARRGGSDSDRSRTTR